MRRIAPFHFAAVLSLCMTLPLAAQQKSVTLATPPADLGSVLPSDFDGWHRTPAKTPSVTAADQKVMAEFGRQSAEGATYQRGDRAIQVTATRFPDATGAYGAFTFYRTPQMAKEKLCSDGASDGNHVLFFCSNILVDVTLDKVTAMTPAELRDLAAAIPHVSGNLAEIPKLPLYLSDKARPGARYVAGPAGLDHLNETVKSSMVDFTLSPEVVVGKEQTLDGTATVVLVQYPTPKIAQAQVQKLNDWAAAQSADWKKTQTIAPASTSAALPTRFATRRTGPIVAVVTGAIAENDMRAILSEINYDAEVTWSEATGNSPKDNIGNLVVNMVYLSFIVVGFMFVFGIVFGGFRVFMHRFFPGKLIDRPEDVEFIKLDLRE